MFRIKIIKKDCWVPGRAFVYNMKGSFTYKILKKEKGFVFYEGIISHNVYKKSEVTMDSNLYSGSIYFID